MSKVYHQKNLVKEHPPLVNDKMFLGYLQFVTLPSNGPQLHYTDLEDEYVFSSSSMSNLGKIRWAKV